jgi:hypothetical protein
VPKVCFPKAISQPVDCFGIFGVGEVDYKTIGKRFFLWLARIHPFVEYEDLISFVACFGLVSFDDEARHIDLF